MCGIAGLVSTQRLNPDDEQWLRTAVASLAHRGPDGEGFEFDREHGVAFGHRRLAIIDLSEGGRQPMRSADSGLLLTYNGEIYNYKDVRSELAARGAQFHSDSDTEVMLAAFAAYGVEAALHRFDGMFAFALHDARNGQLWMGRDRFGEKPLVFTSSGGRTAFASEVRQLRRLPGFDAQLDRSAIESVLDMGFVRQDRTIYSNVQRVQPGELVQFDMRTGGVSRHLWWDATVEAMKVRQSGPSDFAAQVDNLDDVLRTSVRRRMHADVPLGVFLSGGIDSSLTAALAQAQSTSQVKTFTIGLEDEQRSEASEAAAVAKHLGTEHHLLVATSKEALAVVPDLASMYDEPFADSSQIPTHLVSRLAGKHITVALSGDGGDELFGGYNRHMLAVRMDGLLGTRKGLPVRLGATGLGRVPPKAANVVFAAAQRAGVARGWKGDPAGALQKISRIGSADSAESLYGQLAFTGGLLGVRGRSLDRTTRVWSSQASAAEQMMLADTLSYLPGDILTKVDRASMWVGLEARTPYLSHEVFQAAWALPSESRATAKSGKVALKALLCRYVPQQLWDRPKTGFGIPLDQWLAGPLQLWAVDLLGSAATTLGDESATRLKVLWTERPANWQHSVWNALMLVAWIEHSQTN